MRRRVTRRFEKPEPVQRRRFRKPVPDREPPTNILAGTKADFTKEQLSGLESQLEKLIENSWIVVFIGPDYKDVDRVIIKSAAAAFVATFQTRYPEAKVQWVERKQKNKPRALPTGKRFDKRKWQKLAKGRKPAR